VLEEQEAALRGQDRRHRGARWGIGDERAYRRARVWRERSDVDERGHSRMVAGLRDDGTTVGVTDEYDRIALLIDGAGGHGDVVGERRGRVLDDSDGVIVSMKKVGTPTASPSRRRSRRERGRCS
jgi:hypothetical protein